jgi:hypothetical protein
MLAAAGVQAEAGLEGAQALQQQLPAALQDSPQQPDGGKREKQ